MNDRTVAPVRATRANTRVRSRVRAQWLVLGAALIVLAGLLVAWALTRAADRVQVVQISSAVQAGDIIQADDLTLTGVAYDGALQGLVPAGSLQAIVGRVAAIDLRPGSLLVSGMWADAPQLAPGEQSVGAVLAPGRFPSGLSRGDLAVAVPLAGEASPTSVRVIDAAVTESDELLVTLAVPAGTAVVVAQLAAADQLVLIGEPSTEVGG